MKNKLSKLLIIFMALLLVMPVFVYAEGEDGGETPTEEKEEEKDPEPSASPTPTESPTPSPEPTKEPTPTPPPIDARLKSIKITDSNGDEVKIDFKSDVSTYNAKVSSDVSYVNITAEAAENCVVFTGTGKKTLKSGKNSLTVTAKVSSDYDDSGKTQNYIVTIEREAADTSLKNLEITGLALNETFNSKTTNYTVNVDYSFDKLDIVATPTTKGAEIEIVGADKLLVGENIITVKVTLDGTSTEYKIIANKSEKEEDDDNTTSSVIDNSSKEPTDTKKTDTKKSSAIYIVITVLCVLLFILAGVSIYLFRKSKTKEEKDNKKEKTENVKGKVPEEKKAVPVKEVEVKKEDAKVDVPVINKPNELSDEDKTDILEGID